MPAKKSSSSPSPPSHRNEGRITREKKERRAGKIFAPPPCDRDRPPTKEDEEECENNKKSIHHHRHNHPHPPPSVDSIPFERLRKIAFVKGGRFGKHYLVEDSGENNKPSSSSSSFLLSSSCEKPSSPKSTTQNKPSLSSTTTTSSTSSDRRYYSLKCISKNTVFLFQLEETVMNEKYNFQEFSCTGTSGGGSSSSSYASSPFTLTFFGTYQDQDALYYLTDFVQGGNLADFVSKKKRLFTNEEIHFFGANIVASLSYLHRRGFVHRDIKPEHFLIGKDGYLKLCDLSVAKRIPSTVQLPDGGGSEIVTKAYTLCTSLNYMSPEMISGEGYGKSTDWWSVGCLLVFMHTGCTPFLFEGDSDEEEDVKKHAEKLATIGTGNEKFVLPAKMTKDPNLVHVNDLVCKLLAKASDRLGRNVSRKVQEHRYFFKINFESLRKKLVKAPYVPTILHSTDVSNIDVENEEDYAEDLDPYWIDEYQEVFKDF